MRRFRAVDVPLLLAPGALCVWGAYATSNSNQEDVRAAFPVLFLCAFLLYAAAFLATRMLVPNGARVWMLVLLVPAALVTLAAGGLSMAAGYYILAFICKPIWGATVSLLAMGRRPPVRSAPVPA